jgi:hypothetical protein
MAATLQREAAASGHFAAVVARAAAAWCLVHASAGGVADLTTPPTRPGLPRVPVTGRAARRQRTDAAPTPWRGGPRRNAVTCRGPAGFRPRATLEACTSILSAAPSIRRAPCRTPRGAARTAFGPGALRIAAAGNRSPAPTSRIPHAFASRDPGAAFRRLSPFGDPHPPARLAADRTTEMYDSLAARANGVGRLNAGGSGQGFNGRPITKGCAGRG